MDSSDSYSPQSAPVDKRLYAFDLARFIAIVMMMQGHVLDALVSPKFLNVAEFPWGIWHFVRGLTAPIFLLVSGAAHVFVYKRNSQGRLTGDTVRRRLNWAFIVLFLGYLIMFPANRVFDLPFVSAASWKMVLQVNILQLTGISLLLLLTTALFSRSTAVLGIVGAVIGGGILFATPLVHSLPVHDILPLGAANYFSYSGGSIFPIFPYSAFLFIGVAIGAYLQNYEVSKRQGIVRRQGAIAGVALLLFSLASHLFTNNVLGIHLEDQFNPAPMILRVGLALLFFSACSVAIERLQAYKSTFTFLSSRSIYIYCIHLFLIYGTPWSVGLNTYYAKSLTVESGILCAVAIASATLGAVFAHSAFQKRSGKQVQTFAKYGFRAFLLYLFFI